MHKLLFHSINSITISPILSRSFVGSNLSRFPTLLLPSIIITLWRYA